MHYVYFARSTAFALVVAEMALIAVATSVDLLVLARPLSTAEEAFEILGETIVLVHCLHAGTRTVA